ncbi:MAG: rhomboid family intramembrane serine protease [Phycisphaerales bacterium]|nr:rhomboid family intramembrane serine protease [Planctomycetota bacterium]
MGLADRQYAWEDQQSRGLMGPPRMWSVNTWIIVVNVIVFVLGSFIVSPGVPQLQQVSLKDPGTSLAQTEELNRYYLPNGEEASPKQIAAVNQHLMRPIVDSKSKEIVGRSDYLVRPPIEAYGHFSTDRILRLEVWRFVTFQFLHANIWHLFFNMLGLYVFGPIVEKFLGGQRYLAFYLVTGIFGGVMYLVLNLLGIIANSMGISAVPGLLFHLTTTPLVGASAGVFGVIMACAKVEPNTMVQLLFPPVALRMRTFAYGFVALAMVSLLFGAKNAGGEAAHIGGAIAGYYFIRHIHLLRDFFDVFSDSRKKSPKPGWGWLKGGSPEQSAEVDRILGKVRATGVASLTEKEKQILAADTDRLRSSDADRAMGG